VDAAGIQLQPLLARSGVKNKMALDELQRHFRFFRLTPPALAGGTSISATIQLGRSRRHRRALAGGTSTSLLRGGTNRSQTPSGFSRWSFNFTATRNWPDCLAEKLNYHRLKPGGVATSGRADL